MKFAFRGSVYPGDANLTDSFMEEGLREIQPLVGRRWRAVKFDEVVDASGALIWLSPEAFRYYLPSYLIVAVLVGGVTQRAEGAIRVMIFKLTRPTNPKSRGGFDRSMRYFSVEQKVVIRKVLEYLIKSDLGVFANVALNSYWRQIQLS